MYKWEDETPKRVFITILTVPWNTQLESKGIAWANLLLKGDFFLTIRCTPANGTRVLLWSFEMKNLTLFTIEILLTKQIPEFLIRYLNYRLGTNIGHMEGCMNQQATILITMPQSSLLGKPNRKHGQWHKHSMGNNIRSWTYTSTALK